MSETAKRAKLRLTFHQPASCFHSIQKSLRNIPIGIDDVPLELAFNVGDEPVRLTQAHDLRESRARTRLRIPLKSALVRGDEGWPADSNSHASNSGETSNGLRCWSRTERSTSLTSSPG